MTTWYARQGDFQIALDYALQALAMRRQLFGQYHSEIAASLINVGGFYGEKGDLQRALAYSQEGLLMMRKLSSERHPSVARALSNVGFLYRRQGDLRQALEHLQESLTMYRELLGERHPATIEAATKVAITLIASRRRSEAYSIVAYFLTKATPGPATDNLKVLERQLLSKAIRPGFRQAAKRGKRKTKSEHK